MLFPTADFALFFLAVMAGATALAGHHRAGKLFLVAASYLFYGMWNWRFCFLLAASSLLSHATGLAIGATAGRARRLAAGIGIACHLLLLGTFKYLDFTVESLNALARWLGAGTELPFTEILLPVGISFFTFHGISYIVDVFRGDVAVCRRLEDMLLYLSFFPQLVAGPIVRAAQFLPQLAAPPPGPVEVAPALALILGGLFKKVVLANYLATKLVDPVFFDPGAFGTPDLLLAAYGYAVQIYCDFSAYSDMAIGLAALLGYRFPRNFDQPYRAGRLRDFWRRWHISSRPGCATISTSRSRRQPGRALADGAQPDADHAAGRHLARRGVELRRLGRAARRRPARRARPAAGDRTAAAPPGAACSRLRWCSTSSAWPGCSSAPARSTRRWSISRRSPAGGP